MSLLLALLSAGGGVIANTTPSDVVWAHVTPLSEGRASSSVGAVSWSAIASVSSGTSTTTTPATIWLTVDGVAAGSTAAPVAAVTWVTVSASVSGLVSSAVSSVTWLSVSASVAGSASAELGAVAWSSLAPTVDGSVPGSVSNVVWSSLVVGGSTAAETSVVPGLLIVNYSTPDAFGRLDATSTLGSVAWTTQSATVAGTTSPTSNEIVWSSLGPTPDGRLSTSLSSVAWSTIAPVAGAAILVTAAPSTVQWITPGIHTWRVRWEPKMNYSVVFSSHRAALVGQDAVPGDVIARYPDGSYCVATSDRIALGAIPVAFTTVASSPQSRVVELQYVGEIEASLVEIPIGDADELVRLLSTGRVERTTTPAATDIIVGRTDARGNVRLDFSGRRYSSVVPASGTWTRGQLVYHYAPSAGGNVGWVCVASGTPGTWKTFGAIEA